MVWHIYLDYSNTVCKDSRKPNVQTFVFFPGKVHFDVQYMPGTGNFEIQEGGSLIASGRITCPEITRTDSDPSAAADSTTTEFALNTSDVYKELRLRGYDYGPTFQGIVAADKTGTIISLQLHVLSFRQSFTTFTNSLYTNSSR